MNIHPTIYLFLKLNIWLCLTSVLMVVATAMALSISLSTIGVGLILPALLFYFIYTEDRRNTSPEDHINQPYRTQMVEKHQNPLLFTEIVALGAYELIVGFLTLTSSAIGLEYLLFAQLPLVVLVVYDQLKRYPTFDSLAVGSTWSFVIVFSVLLSSGHAISLDVLVVFATWLMIVFAGVESRNVQDIEGDTETKKTTLAGYLGERKTGYLNVGLKTLGVVIFLITAGALAAGVVTAYVLLLQAFRILTQRVDEATQAQPVSPDPDPVIS